MWTECRPVVDVPSEKTIVAFLLSWREHPGPRAGRDELVDYVDCHLCRKVDA